MVGSLASRDGPSHRNFCPDLFYLFDSFFTTSCRFEELSFGLVLRTRPGKRLFAELASVHTDASSNLFGPMGPRVTRFPDRAPYKHLQKSFLFVVCFPNGADDEKLALGEFLSLLPARLEFRDTFDLASRSPSCGSGFSILRCDDALIY